MLYMVENLMRLSLEVMCKIENEEVGMLIGFF